ncbi:hypothetical protein PENANT_c002G01488 [Penicillium antarcticum]|uniref:Transcription factor domain-containing protein n=1 Tax=Penicillium antarcticum TaxID=416450 RepID=A0A1V6QK84_9EURO|nr:hypothetical protein PENANT_c002G01488 [Penicillium antarcticum]
MIRDSPVVIRSTSPDPKATGKRQRDESSDTGPKSNGTSFSSPFNLIKSAQKPAAKRAKLNADNETEIRCQLINDINIQRTNHRNITSNDLRDIIALLIQAKKKRNLDSPSEEEKEQWLEQDELMELAANKMERGGRCSRAALSRWELFLTAPMVEETDKKDLERAIAVEESHSAVSVAAPYNFLQLRRLLRILQDPAAYGVENNAPAKTYLTSMVADAIANKWALTRATHKAIVDFLDPEKEIIIPDPPPLKKSTDEQGAPKPKKKVLPSSKTPQTSAPSSHAHSTQLQKDLADVSASPPTPFVITLKDSQSTPNLNMPSYSKFRVSSGNASSRPSSLQPQQPQQPKETQQQASTQLKPDTPIKLMKIFMEHVAPLVPIFDLDDLDRLLRMASLHGTFAFRDVDPTLGLCFALAALQSRDRAHWKSREWYRGAEAEINTDEVSENSILAIQRRILQVLYLQMIGNIHRAWSILSLALGLAEANGIQTVAGGPLAVDSTSQQRVRVLWHSLWMTRLSLASQMGMNWQSLETRYPVPMPTDIPLGSKHVEDILCNDEHLRLRIDVCPFRSLFTADLCDFFELDGKLLKWKEALPYNLHWDGTGVSLSMETDPAIRRLRVLIRLRYLSIRLRVFRPFLIFCLRLSHTCSCASNPSHAYAPGPHILTGKDAGSVDSPAILGIVRDSTLKCLAAAQDIIKILTDLHGKGIGKGNDDILRITTSSYECLDYIYTSALILIACRAIPFTVKGASANKSVSSMNDQIRQADVLLRNYEESSQQTDELTGRTQRCREILDLLKGQIGSGPMAQNPSLFSDMRVSVGQHVWKRLYDRLGLQEEGSFQEVSSSNSSAGRKNLFAWIESLPTDLDGWDPAKTQIN